jgi:cell division protein FtsL
VATAAPVQQAVQAEQPLYTPQMPSVSFNARSDATIFRADNPVNAVKDQAVAASAANFVQPVTPFEEEENEDLIPTMTTRQYRSRQAKEKEQEKSKGFTLSKKEKVIVGCFIGLVVLLFTVIIINSAIISGLNSGIGKLQNTYEAMEENYQQLTEELNDAQQPESILAKAEEWHLLP